MGRNKDQKVRRKNAAGIARNRAREQQASDPGSGDAEGNDEWMIDCPKCGAVANEACTTPSGRPASKTHAIRLK